MGSSMKDNIKFILWITLLLLPMFTSCSEVQAQLNYKTILLGETTSVEDLKAVLDDWPAIERALLTYLNSSCDVVDVSMDKISSLDRLSESKAREYIQEGSIVESSLVISLGTEPLCGYDDNSSYPTWILQVTGTGYVVLDSFKLSE